MNHDDDRTLTLMEKYPKPKKTTKTNSAKPKSKGTTVSKSTPKVRKRIPQKRSKIPSFFIKLALGLIACVFIIFGGRYLYDHTINYNPLLGTWHAQTVMGIMEISFERESVSSFGVQRAVSYDVKENEVIVMDDNIKIGERYRIIDDNTISVQSGASKMTFKRVK
ncbi:MAG: hypothetical protein PHN18_02980 [Sulfurospirillaceae bacterium]|nr:hypothetical protein [Sulfurospirillaceae bacterium]MDD2825629.1 hypothetical protein [Sulfurospirillaceae bacterium]